ncbi:MAG: Clp protease ClpP [Rikenellaceae bacterium]|nr:Clp protease ClpP [Rikenellaceae bacterium]
MSFKPIKITNQADGVTVIDIEGEIGVPEELQFEEPESRVATYRKFKDMVGSIAQIRSPKVLVNIRSTGGDVGDAMLIYDALCSLDAEITTRCWGYVASAATIIAQAASTGLREISSESLYLIHRSVSRVEGDAESMQHNAELLAKTDAQIASIYAERSGRAVEEFERLMSENEGMGRWLTPEEAIEAGLVDRVVEREMQRRGFGQRIRAAVGRLLGKLGGEDSPQIPHTYEARSNVRATTPKVQTTVDIMRRAQQLAQPTSLTEIEDPDVGDVRQSFNEAAYDRDAENFRIQ